MPIMLSVLLWYIVLTSSISTAQVCPIENRNLTKNVIFDVTEPLDDMLLDRHGLATSKFLTDNHLSYHLYYRLELGQNRTFSWENTNYKELHWLPSTMSEYHDVGISLVMEACNLYTEIENGSLQNHNNPSDFVQHKIYTPEFVIYKVLHKSFVNCSVYCPDEMVMSSITTHINEVGIKNVGLEYNERYMECCANRYPRMWHQVEIAILNVELKLSAMYLSYSKFSSYLSELYEKNKVFVKNLNADSEPYIRITISELDKQFAERYRAYISKYSENWVKTFNKATKIITDSFLVTVKIPWLENKKIKNVYPTFMEDHFKNITKFNLYNVAKSPCQAQTLLQTIGQVYENMHISFSQVEWIDSFLTECNKERTTDQSLEYPNLHITTNEFSSASDAIRIMDRIGSSGPYKLKAVYFSDFEESRFPSHDSPDAKLFWKDVVSRNIMIGCDQTISLFTTSFDINKIIKACDWILKKSPLISLNVVLSIESNDYTHLQRVFGFAVNATKNFLNKYPGGEINFHVTSSDPVLNTYEIKSYTNMYCERRLETFHEFNQAVEHLAQVYNITVIFQPVVDSTFTGLWHNVNTDTELNRTTIDFIVLVRRNVPEGIEGSTQFPHMFPCLNLTIGLNARNNFEKNSYAGISISSNFKRKSKLSVEELQTMLLYSFGKFLTVEVVTTETTTTLDAVANSLTSELFQALLTHTRIDMLRLYVETNYTSSLVSYIENFNEKKSSFLSGIHISGWESHDDTTEEHLLSLLKSIREHNTSYIDFGLSVKNCLDEMNLNLSQIRRLGYISYVSYIVCNVKSVPPSNSDQQIVQLYLDTNFYVREYFRVMLGIDVIFRVQFKSIQCNKFHATDKASYLYFLNDLNQHSLAYGIRYFLGDAFSYNEGDSECTWAWWQLSRNVTDFTNDAAYIELESEYFGLPTQRKFRISSTVTDVKTLNYLSIVGVFALAMVLTGISVCLWIYHKRFLKKIPTEQVVTKLEIEMSLKNNTRLEDEDLLTETPCPQRILVRAQFEISKEQIKLGDEIGRGHYGVVYKGIVSTQLGTSSVAVKTPSMNCSKEYFATMLTEVEILSYIGSHPNVVAFIGAYTQEVENNFIYILTELCEKGSLLEYLKSTKPKTVPDLPKIEASDECLPDYMPNIAPKCKAVQTDNNKDVNMRELYRFSFEIASGMDYIAGKRVVHLDLSARNVFLKGDHLTCKIGDFGLSRKLEDNDEYVKQSNDALPWRWMAVESLKLMEFTTKSDVWSYGVTLWEIFTFGNVPFSKVIKPVSMFHFGQMLEDCFESFQLEKPRFATEKIYDKMLECWRLSKDERPNFDDLTIFFEKLLSDI